MCKGASGGRGAGCQGSEFRGTGRWEGEWEENEKGRWGQGCIRREGTSEVALEAVKQAVGGGCQKQLGAVTVGYKRH